MEILISLTIVIAATTYLVAKGKTNGANNSINR